MLITPLSWAVKLCLVLKHNFLRKGSKNRYSSLDAESWSSCKFFKSDFTFLKRIQCNLLIIFTNTWVWTWVMKVGFQGPRFTIKLYCLLAAIRQVINWLIAHIYSIFKAEWTFYIYWYQLFLNGMYCFLVCWYMVYCCMHHRRWRLSCILVLRKKLDNISTIISLLKWSAGQSHTITHCFIFLSRHSSSIHSM